MIARFIGTDGSLGYRNGQVYKLSITEQGHYVIITSPRPCPYSSWKTFFQNWERVNNDNRPAN